MDGITLSSRWFTAHRARPEADTRGLEAEIFDRLAEHLEADAMPSATITELLADLTEIRSWLDQPLWLMTAEHADAYFCRQIAAWHYPARLRQAEALACYFALLLTSHHAPMGELATIAVRSPLDHLNWPIPAKARHARTTQAIEPPAARGVLSPARLLPVIASHAAAMPRSASSASSSSSTAGSLG